MELKYMITCVSGAEEIVKDELQSMFPQVHNIMVLKGKLLFYYDEQWAELLRLRCVDNIYAMLGEFGLGSHKKHLAEMQVKIKKLPIKSFIEKVQKNGKNIIVSASRSGKQTYSRFDIKASLENILLSEYDYVLGDAKNHDLAFRLDLKENNAILSIQLTEANFKYRSDDYKSSKGGIRPTVAHCLVRLSNPKNDEIFYDPFCGSGSIVHERKNYKARKIFASDIAQDVLEVARINLGTDVIIFQADARNTKVKDKSIDTIVSNIPWGKQISVDNINELYISFVNELVRILKPNGKAIILTNQTKELINAVIVYEMNIEKIADFSLHGLHPSVFIITKSITSK